MKKRIFAVVLAMLLVMVAQAFAGTVQLPQTGQTTCYDAGGGVIDCTGTGQDGDKKMGATWPEPRFTNKGNGTVTDNLTGLIWLQNVNCAGEKTWADALPWSNSLASGACGLTDGSVAGNWRLPNIEELESLFDLQRYFPALPSGHPFSLVLPSGCYWSSSTYADNTGYAWTVDMYSGIVGDHCKDTNCHCYVWPVRGGQ